MTACPPASELDRWLHEAVEPAVAQSTAAHVEGCQTCKLRVEKLRTGIGVTSAPSLRRTMPSTPVVGPPPLEETTSPSFPRLDEVPRDEESTADLRATYLRQRTPKPASPGEVLEPGETLGRFVVLSRLGEGGMGVVYAAYDPELDRKVAIKLLRSDLPTPRAEDLRNRLLREAQAMARLSHPNVVPVYDVGTMDGQVFVAMEFIEGKTLAAHLRGVQSWRQAVSLYLLAGKGLAAAHAAGLIHRDFKPQNVLVSNDGQVRVLDFGLARPAGQSEPPQSPMSPLVPVPPGSRSPSGRPLLNTPLTQTGIIMGTPAYMSPEQFAAGLVDARTDQFAFCVSLFEALYGMRPFEADTVVDLTRAIRDGKIVAPPKGSKVPSRFFKLLKRGLAAEPAARYASMEELLKELQRDPGATTRRALGAVALLTAIAAAVGAGVWSQRQQRLLCTGAEARLAGAWDADRKDALLRAFIGTGVPYAPEVFSTATRLLDSYTQSWVQMRTDACEATRLRGEQSERLLDLRMQCLDRKLGEVGALLTLFATPDARVVDRAVPAVQALGSLNECSDPRALGAEPAAIPEKAKKEMDAAYAKLAEAKAASAALEPAKALDLANQAAALAAQSGQLPAVAETKAVVADLRGRLGDDRGAEEELLASAISADSAKRDDLRAKALTELSLVVFREGRPTESLSWGQVANAALARAGGDDVVQARLHHILALVFHQLGRPDEAAAHFGKCLDLRKKAFGADSYVAAAAMQAFGKTLHEEGKIDEAVQHLRNSVALQEKALGAKHPDVAVARQALGAALAAKGDFAAAAAEQRTAIGILEDGLLVGAAHADLSRTLKASGDAKGAMSEQELALTSYLGALPAKHPSIAQAYADLGALQLEAGEKKDALATVKKAVALLDVDASPPGMVARATLVEVKAMLASGQKKPAREKAKAVLLKLEARAPKDAAVKALRDWTVGARE